MSWKMRGMRSSGFVLLGAALLFLGSGPAGSDRSRAPRPRNVEDVEAQGYLCSLGGKLAADLLDDEHLVPHALYVSEGVMTGGEARFQLYANVHDFMHYQVTGDRFWNHRRFQYGARRVKATVRGVPGTLKFVTPAGAFTEIVYRPRRQSPKDRLAILEFTYTCSLPRHRHQTRFLLDVPGTGSGTAAHD